MTSRGTGTSASWLRAGLLVATAAAVVAHLLIAALLLERLREGALVGDWPAFYAAGHIVRSGDGGRLYDAGAQAAAQHALFGDVAVDSFPLPAFTALVFAPLSALSFAQAYLAWLVVNLALLSALAALAWRSLARVDRAARVAFVGGSVISTPVLRVLTGAQIDLFVVAALAGCYALVRTGRPFRGGLLLALALVKPHLLLGALALLAVRRQWRALAGLALAGAPLLTLPVLVTGVGGVRDQAALLASYPASSTDHGVAADKMVNLRGLVVGLTGSGDMRLWLPLLAVTSAVCVCAALGVWRSRLAGDAQSWALAVVLPLICSPHVHAYTLVLLLVAGGLYLLARADAGDPLLAEAVVVAALALTVVCLVSLLIVPIAGVAVLALFALFVTRWPRGAPLRADAPRPIEGRAPRPVSVASGSGGRYTAADGAIV